MRLLFGLVLLATACGQAGPDDAATSAAGPPKPGFSKYPPGAGAPGELPADFDATTYGSQQARDDFYCAGLTQEWFRQTKLTPQNVAEVVELTTPLASTATDALLQIGANASMIVATSDYHSEDGAKGYKSGEPRITLEACLARQKELPAYDIP